MRDELDVEPNPDTQRLHRAILNSIVDDEAVALLHTAEEPPAVSTKCTRLVVPSVSEQRADGAGRPTAAGGTDGVRVFTVDDGWGWIFTAIEHWNAECVGWHVCKRGDRFAALQPISMGLARLYASTSAGAARGLALRMDHGSQYLSDHFTNQIKFWGIQPSYAFVEQRMWSSGVAL